MRRAWMVVALAVLGVGALAGALAGADPNEAWQDQRTRKVWIEVARQEGDQVVVPVAIDDLAKVVAIDLDLVFDSGALTIAEVRRTDLLSGFLLISNVVADTLKIAIAGAQAGEGSGTFLEVVVEGGGGPVEFGIGKVLLNGDLIPVEYEKAGGEEGVPPDTTAVPPDTTAVPLDTTAVRRMDTLPPGFRLGQNYPNPFNASTRIEYSLAETCQVELAVFNAAGQRVLLLVEGEWPAGSHWVQWDGKDGEGRPVASGRYVARLVAGDFRKEIGMALVR